MSVLLHSQLNDLIGKSVEAEKLQVSLLSVRGMCFALLNCLKRLLLLLVIGFTVNMIDLACGKRRA